MATAKALVAMAEGEKPHSSISDWVEILTSDRYEEDSYDGVNELLESVRILGMDGVTESSRAIRKKLKYGNVHRQLRALTVCIASSVRSQCSHINVFRNLSFSGLCQRTEGRDTRALSPTNNCSSDLRTWLPM
jgi:hypothetical protein